MTPVTELRKIVNHLDSNNKQFIEFKQQNTVGKYLSVKNYAYATISILVLSLLIIEWLLMPVRDIGNIAYYFFSLNVDVLKNEYGFFKILISGSVFTLLFEVLRSAYSFSRTSPVNVKDLSYDVKIKCIDIYFNSTKINNELADDFQFILSDFKSFHQKHDINKYKDLLFNREVEILNKFINSNVGKNTFKK